MEAVGFAARRELLTSGQLAHFSTIHIATHAVTDVARPELSGLVFSMVDPKGAPRNGYLRLHEIASLRLPAKLVTLSACGTGLGKQMGPEGTIGLARGFLYAGASAVVVSLWDVEDESTAELMQLFYESMLGVRHLPPAAALRQAQIAMSKKQRWTAYHWSGWAVIGDWR
jgi:CHAT domain-containing protein